jgi:hypothetical protein
MARAFLITDVFHDLPQRSESSRFSTTRRDETKSSCVRYMTARAFTGVARALRIFEVPRAALS